MILYEQLYTMNLGEIIKMAYWEITRVPGGWIFQCGNSDAISSVFVPYDSEFDQRKPEPTPVPSSGDRISTGF